MKLFYLIFYLAITSVFSASSQNGSGEFKIVIDLKHTPVISQGSTGTCWSFATASFLESEIMRKGFPETDLSEMYFVYHAYKNKAQKYLLYHGKNSFSQGGQAHDVFDVLREYGMVTNEAFSGKKIDGRFRHRDLDNAMDNEVAALNKNQEGFDASALKSFDPILKEHIGKVPKKVKTNVGKITPIKFSNKYAINPDDYIELTSYAHHPFYKPFVLEIPDNWSQGLYYNLPVDELVEVMLNSLNKGYTFCWDGDTSEKTFSHNSGNADLPKRQKGKADQDLRQKTFFDRTTTDDHLMHIVGLSKDNEGQTCFYTKNSWGAESNSFGGYLHLTEDYVRLKTIAILVHKNAVPENIRKKMNL